jgi:hypothetical protein
VCPMGAFTGAPIGTVLFNHAALSRQLSPLSVQALGFDQVLASES